jgi:hypothetical protein
VEPVELGGLETEPAEVAGVEVPLEVAVVEWDASLLSSLPPKDEILG